MDKQQNKYIAGDYRLYTVENGEETLVGESPFHFISGMGMNLAAFEQHIVDVEAGSDFDFKVDKADAYGDYSEEYIHKFEREMFCINGHFDHEHIYPGAVVPLQDEEGHRFEGRVSEVTEESVTIDMNPPFAGKDLVFRGHVSENREATNEEMVRLINQMTAESCGCGCDDCDDGCGGCGHDHDHHHDHDHGCGCGHCHH